MLLTSSVAAPASVSAPVTTYTCSSQMPVGNLKNISSSGSSTESATPVVPPQSTPTPVPTTGPTPQSSIPRLNASSPCYSNVTTLQPIADASIQQANPASTGNWGNIEVYGKPGGKTIIALLQFDLSTIPKGVEKAELKLWAVVARNTPGILTVFSSDEGWDETVTWNSRPVRGDAIANMTVDQLSEDRPGEGKPAGYYIVDVTNFIAARATNTTASRKVSFWLEDVQLDYLAMKFESRRSDKIYPPLLTITASKETCELVIVGQFALAVPDVAAFLANEEAKNATCTAIAVHGSVTSQSRSSIVCRFGTPLARRTIYTSSGDLFVKYAVTISAEADAVTQSRVSESLTGMTMLQMETAVATQMALRLGASANDFQVIVEGQTATTRGGAEALASFHAAPTSAPTMPTGAPTQVRTTTFLL